MNLMLYMGLILFLCMTPSVAAKLGIQSVGTASSMIVVFLSMLNILCQVNKSIFLSRFKEELFIVVVAILDIFIRLMLGEYEAIKLSLFFLIIPMLLSILISSSTYQKKLNIIKIIIAIFIIECGIAIYEKINLTNLFPDIDDTEISKAAIIEKFVGFRSTALFGHPLNNALCVSIMMGFIAVSNINKQLKAALIIMGYIAILAFNARGAAIIWGFIGGYLILSTHSSRVGILNRLIPLALFSLVIGISYEFLIDHGFGDRLITGELMDGSALTRIEVFSAFNYIDSYDFWLGNQLNYTEVMNMLGAGGVENSYIVILIRHGVIIGFILFCSYFLWIKKLTLKFNFQHKILIVFSLILVGSTNNGLSASLPWGIFAICANAFQSRQQKDHKRFLGIGP